MEAYLRLALILILGSVFILIMWQLRPGRQKIHIDLPNNDLIDESSLLEQNEELADESFARITQDIIKEQEREELRNIGPGTIKQSKPIVSNGNLLSLSVFAKLGGHFASYDLVQAIAATGMQFGEMNIFHYYQRDLQGKKSTLFNLASATKPGDFDLDRMGNFSCVGLTLFMDISQVSNPLQAFYLMVSTAEQLAEDLDGELRLNPTTMWNDEYFQEYQQRIFDLAGHPEHAEPVPAS